MGWYTIDFDGVRGVPSYPAVTLDEMNNLNTFIEFNNIYCLDLIISLSHLA